MANGKHEEAFLVERQEGRGKSKLCLSGVIDEFADLNFLSHLHGRVEIDMRGVRRINSFGVRVWVDSIRSLPEDADVTFLEVPPPIVEQMSMVQGFLGRARVASILAPMMCEECEHHELKLFPVEQVKPGAQALGAVKCPECGGPMELDDIEEQYFAFLKDS